MRIQRGNGENVCKFVKNKYTECTMCAEERGDVMHLKRYGLSCNARGSALIVALITMVIMLGLSVSYIETVMSDGRATDRTLEEAKAEAIATAGLHAIINRIRSGAIQTAGSSTFNFDNRPATVAYVPDALDATKYVVTSTVRFGQTTKAIQAKVK